MRWKVDHALERLRDVSTVDVALDDAPSDDLLALWVDDVCWQVHATGWYLRRPPWWNISARSSWWAQWRQLATASELLRQRAAVSGA